jgi:hypothetical protein
MKLALQIKNICEELVGLANSLGYKRSELPQIPSDKYYDFLDYLDEIGCSYEQKQIPAEQLTPSQNELDTDKADKIWNDGAIDQPIMTSADNYILDGHHRWFAVKRNAPDLQMDCVVLNTDAQSAIKIMHDFEHAKVKDINDKKVSEDFDFKHKIIQIMQKVGELSYTLNKNFKFWYGNDYTDKVRDLTKDVTAFYRDIRDSDDKDEKSQMEIVAKYKPKIIELKNHIISNREEFNQQSKTTQNKVAGNLLDLEKLL